MGFGGMREREANGNGYMAQIRVRLGAAINMIIPLEGMKEGGKDGGNLDILYTFGRL